MDAQNLGLYTLMGISANSVLQRANPAIADFFSSNFVVFILVAVYVNKISQDKNILVTIASAFFAVILVKMITIQDFKNMMESFELIYPGPTSSPNCLKINKAQLVSGFESENKLKGAMVEAGVPMNMELNDINAAEIATYLVNANPSSFTGCELVKE